jgi:hypothetical protein
VRENEGAQQSVANIVISSEAKSGATVVKQGESSTESKSTVAAVMFDPNVMAVSKKILGTYSVPDVVSILKYGSQITQSPTADTVVTDFCCNLDYVAVQNLLNMRFGDVRCYSQCSFEQMKGYANDKLKAYVVPEFMSTLEAVVCFKRLGHVLGRVFGFNDRLLKMWENCANAVSNISIMNKSLFKRFDTNNSAVILFNEVLRIISQSCTSRATTAESLEVAFDTLNLDVTRSWVQRVLNEVKEEEFDRILAGGVSKSVGKRSSVDTSPLEPEPAKKISKGTTKPVAAASSSLSSSSSSTSSTVSAGSGICKYDCSTQGCSNSKCRFLHLRRKLTRSEKDQVKAEIAKFNNTPGMNPSKKLKEEPRVLG